MKTIPLLNHEKPAMVDDEDYDMLMEFGVWSFMWSDKCQENRVVCTLDDGSEIDMAELVAEAANVGQKLILERLRAFRRDPGKGF